MGILEKAFERFIAVSSCMEKLSTDYLEFAQKICELALL